ncbi:MAG: hypothetical protein WD883_00520 [Candidatus Colwellbacteria bacterium]
MRQEDIKKESAWSWRISDEDLKNQVDNYSSLKITESYRGVLVLVFSAIVVLSTLLGVFTDYVSLGAAVLGTVIYVFLLAFVYKGHRWAIIALMVLWTLDKAASVIEFGRITPLFWWFLLMPILYRALRVENERRKV